MFVSHFPGERGAYPSGHLVAWDVARRTRRGITPLLWRAQRQGHVCCARTPACHDGEGTTDSERDFFQPGMWLLRGGFQSFFTVLVFFNSYWESTCFLRFTFHTRLMAGIWWRHRTGAGSTCAPEMWKIWHRPGTSTITFSDASQNNSLR